MVKKFFGGRGNVSSVCCFVYVVVGSCSLPSFVVVCLFLVLPLFICFLVLVSCCCFCSCCCFVVCVVQVCFVLGFALIGLELFAMGPGIMAFTGGLLILLSSMTFEELGVNYLGIVLFASPLIN